MDRWLVTQGDHQFSVDGVGELRTLAGAGKLRSGDMVQPPGASDWVYAMEVPALKGLFADSKSGDEDDLDYKRSGLGAVLPVLVGVSLLGMLVVGVAAAGMLVTQLPTGEESILGAGGLTYSEMLVTAPDAGLRAEPEANSPVKTGVAKDSALELLAKRGQFYLARDKAGTEGWIGVTQVVPMYQLGDATVQAAYDPLYNPDRYVDVPNASWMQLPEQQKEQLTVFQIALHNGSDFAMTDVVLLATIKDAKGQKLEAIEVPIEGEIPAQDTTLIGTLAPDKKDKEGIKRIMTQAAFDELAKEDQELQLRWSSGAEVRMNTTDFDAAQIDFLQLRAVPNEQVAQR